MAEAIRSSLHRVNIKINAAENWVSPLETDTIDVYGGLKNNQMLKKKGREDGIKEGIPLGDNSFQKIYK